MKKKFVMLLTCALFTTMLTACQAEDVNKALNSATEKMGIEAEFNVTQDQIDSLEKKAKESKDTIESIVTDEDVQKNIKEVLESVSDAAKKSKSE